jgi:streptomycin 6-kinase
MTDHSFLPEDFVRTNLEQRGTIGAAWLERLPAILADCERRWSLKIGPPFPQLSYNYAARASYPDGRTAVVKVCVPDREFQTETEALRLYAGQGSVELLDADLPSGVMLLEDVRPGTLLSSVQDDREATSIAAAVMRRIRRPAPTDHTFPTIADWGKGFERLRRWFDGGTGPFPPQLVERAESLFSGLLASMGDPVVLHGDLHHFNILAAEREPWLMIDPKGVVGEAEYEVGAFLRNPIPDIYTHPDLVQLLTRRVDQFSEELGFDRERVRDWGMSQAVLSAWWYFEDTEGNGGEDLRLSLGFAEIMAQVR